MSDDWTGTNFSFFVCLKSLEGRKGPEEEFLQTVPDLLPIASLYAAVIPRFGWVVIEILHCISAHQPHNPSSSTACVAQTKGQGHGYFLDEQSNLWGPHSTGFPQDWPCQCLNIVMITVKVSTWKSILSTFSSFQRKLCTFGGKKNKIQSGFCSI